MTTYLISTSKKHYTVAHLVATDGIHALCTYKPGEKMWPRDGGEITGGKWILSEDIGDRMVCSICKSKANPKRHPPVATRAERKRAEELERLRQWNESAKLVLDNGGD